MPRNITITFNDGASHRYENIPDSVTPDMIEARVSKDFPGKTISNIDGGRKSSQPSELNQVKKNAGISSQDADSNILKIQKQYDWQFSDTKGPDQIVKIVDRKAGGKVAITAKNRYFLILSKVPAGMDPGPYGLMLMSVPKEILG
jgi:hypothetical protein